jgi:Zn-dependent peptidase ImmA (M78 family)/transcriptional regulator with XRE-family HTH domain
MTRDVAYVTGAVVRWARDRAGLERAQLAQRIGQGLGAEHIAAWESGGARPTLAQAEKLAEKLRVPFAILFMSEPPEIEIPLPDLRTVAGTPRARPTPEFLDVISDCLLRQSWYRENQERTGAEPLEFVGRFSPNDSVEVVARDMSSTLNVSDQLRSGCGSWLSFLTQLVDRSEAAGVLTMRSSVVRHSSRRAITVGEFRGFAVCDNLAPLIFVNSRDARAAQTFTIAHELAHIWIAESGVSNLDPKAPPSGLPLIERFCNAVAAELLVPAESLERLWDNRQSVEAAIGAVAGFHRVSRLVTIIRARDLGKISWTNASQLIDAEYERYEMESEERQAKEGGPSFWVPFTSRSSARLAEAVVSALRGGRLTHRDAADLLGVKLGTLAKYSARLAGR